MSAAVVGALPAPVPSHVTMPSTATASCKLKVEDKFVVDAVLFDMDGTLTDSIAAVEAAWGKVADDLGLGRAEVIAATHGKRAVDNLAHFRPEIKAHEMDDAVSAFEQSILDFADAYTLSRMVTPTNSSSGWSTPGLNSNNSSSSGISSGVSSRSDSFSSPHRPSIGEVTIRRPSFATQLSNRLAMTPLVEDEIAVDLSEDDKKVVIQGTLNAWHAESESVDRSIRILPGVKALIDSLPEGRYAVATSGAKIYAFGAMTRVGIKPPMVTITADDKRLKAGKPAPDPFLLAASCLGFDAKRCVVFEDSPSGIRAGVASGATVVAVCTSHERSKIENCGAHFIVDNLRDVHCEVVRSGTDVRLKFTVWHTPSLFHQ